MTTLRYLTSSLALILILAVSAIAGDIYIPAPPPPPSSSCSAVAAKDTATPGDIYVGKANSDSVADAALNLLQAFLTVF